MLPPPPPPPELDLANCMLFSVREKAGLGSPPSPYYTNEVESKNRVLQHLSWT